jgi:hypothetical protein
MSIFLFHIRRRIEVEAASEQEAYDKANSILMDSRGFADFDYDVDESEKEESE